MTNSEILRLFKTKYPDVEVSDYRPISDMYLPKGQEGIVIWIENGDCILYFPNKTSSV